MMATGNTVFDRVTYAEDWGEFGDDLFDMIRKRAKLATISELQFLMVTEIQFQLHERGEMEQLVPKFGKFLAETTSHLA